MRRKCGEHSIIESTRLQDRRTISTYYMHEASGLALGSDWLRMLYLQPSLIVGKIAHVFASYRGTPWGRGQ